MYMDPQLDQLELPGLNVVLKGSNPPLPMTIKFNNHPTDLLRSRVECPVNGLVTKL